MRTNCLIQEIVSDIVQIYAAEVLVIDCSGDIIAYANMPMTKVNDLIVAFRAGNKFEFSDIHVSKIRDEISCELKYIVFLKSVKGEAVLSKILSNQIIKISDWTNGNNSIEAVYRKLILDESVDLKLLVQYKNLIAERSRTVIVAFFYKTVTNIVFNTIKESFRINDDEAIFLVSLNKVVIVKNVINHDIDKIIKVAKRYIAGSRAKNTIIGIGKEVTRADELKLSYQSAALSLVGIDIEEQEQRVQCYDRLGIRRLIFSMSYDSRVELIQDIFKVSNGDELNFQELKLLNSYITEDFNMRKAAEKNNVDKKKIRKLIDEYSDLLGADLSQFYTAVKFKIGYLIGISLKNS